ncbi:Serine/Threonine-kinase [Perilla frutescens var. frutescens]|nr:Serine/Threonine-kinase [Perilla frutescens var. frutescens]
MASLCNLALRPPPAFPAKKPVVGGTILSRRPVFLRTPPRCLAAKTSSITPKDTQSEKYVYPDPIPEFAAAETEKFKAELLKKLSKEKEAFGNDLQMVVDVCAEILGEFLNKDYGGPGTLLIEPFTDMMIALKEKNLPGAPLAARSSLLWAQNFIDQDWEFWNSKSHE